MGKGKLQKFADLETYRHVIQEPFRALSQEDSPWKGKWNTDFFQNSNPVVLELGCGKGEYTVKMAQRYPDKNFIGVDIKGARMWKGAKEVQEQAIPNACFLRTNIEIIDHFFAPGEVSEIWLTFPDPQMKRTRKRLTATNFINKYRQFMAMNGVIHLKCDSNFQYLYTKAMIAENGFEILKDTDNLYASSLLNEELSIQTFYEKQWLDRGITIKYLCFRISHHEPLREPDVEIEKDPYRSFGRSARE